MKYIFTPHSSLILCRLVVHVYGAVIAWSVPIMGRTGFSRVARVAQCMGCQSQAAQLTACNS